MRRNSRLALVALVALSWLGYGCDPAERTRPWIKRFEVQPTLLPSGGGDVSIHWEVEGVEWVRIGPLEGLQSFKGSTSIRIEQTTQLRLSAGSPMGVLEHSIDVIVAEPTQEINGLVVDYYGRPLAEMLVMVEGQRTTTDEAGRFQFDAVGMKYDVVAAKRTHGHETHYLGLSHPNPRLVMLWDEFGLAGGGVNLPPIHSASVEGVATVPPELLGPPHVSTTGVQVLLDGVGGGSGGYESPLPFSFNLKWRGPEQTRGDILSIHTNYLDSIQNSVSGVTAVAYLPDLDFTNQGTNTGIELNLQAASFQEVEGDVTLPPWAGHVSLQTIWRIKDLLGTEVGFLSNHSAKFRYPMPSAPFARSLLQLNAFKREEAPANCNCHGYSTAVVEIEVEQQGAVSVSLPDIPVPNLSDHARIRSDTSFGWTGSGASPCHFGLVGSSPALDVFTGSGAVQPSSLPVIHNPILVFEPGTKGVWRLTCFQSLSSMDELVTHEEFENVFHFLAPQQSSGFYDHQFEVTEE